MAFRSPFPTSSAPSVSGGKFRSSFPGGKKTQPVQKARAGFQIWNGQQIPADIPTRYLYAYDPATDVRTFKLSGGGVYSQDKDNNIVKTPRTNYGGVPTKEGFERDDIIPVGLGGVNSARENINPIPKKRAREQAILETKLINQVKRGEISPKAAINEALRMKIDLAARPTFIQKIKNYVINTGQGLGDLFGGRIKLGPLSTNEKLAEQTTFGGVLKESFKLALGDTAQTVVDVPSVLAGQGKHIWDFALVKPKNDSVKEKASAGLQTLGNLPGSVFANLILKPVLDLAATGQEVINETIYDGLDPEGQGVKIPGGIKSAFGNKTMDIQGAQSVYAESINAGRNSTEAFTDSLLKLTGDLAVAVPLSVGMAKIGFRAYSPEVLLKKIEVSRNQLRSITTGNEAGTNGYVKVPVEVIQAFKNMTPAQKSAVAKNLLSNMRTPEPSRLGKILGVTPEEAQALYNDWLKKGVPKAPLQLKPFPKEAEIPPKSAPGRAITPETTTAIDSFSGAPIRTIPLSKINLAEKGQVKSETIDKVVEDGVIKRPVELKINSDGTYDVVDGNNRIVAAKLLGQKDVSAILQNERPSIKDLDQQISKIKVTEQQPVVPRVSEQAKLNIPEESRSIVDQAFSIVEGSKTGSIGKFKSVIIKKVSPNKIRNKGIGDYKRTADGGIEILVSDQLNDIDFRKTAVHELVEATLADQRGVSFDEINKFDKENINAAQPGNLKNAPYHREHMIATEAEKLIKEKAPIRKKPETPAQPPSKKSPPPPDKFQSRVFQRLQAEHPEILEGDLGYNRTQIVDEIKKAAELLEKDKDKLYQIAMGIEESSNLTQTAANIVMFEKALQEGNNDLVSRLIKNRSLAQTRRGQEIVTEKGSVTDNSVARYVKELLDARMNKLGSKYLDTIGDKLNKMRGKTTSAKKRAVEIIDKEVKKVKKVLNSKELDLKEAQAIIDSLACK